MANEKNLKPCKKGETHNPNGRPKKLVNAIKDLPPHMMEDIHGILGYALTLESETEAKRYLEAKAEELGQYGFLMQIAIRQLSNKNYGWNAAMDIMDRLYGKPRQSAEVKHTGEGISIIVNNEDEKKRIIAELLVRNGQILDGSWREGWQAFCQSEAHPYKKFMAGAHRPEGHYIMQDGPDGYQMFAHYLDCEAHTDVWRELYKTYNYTNDI